MKDEEWMIDENFNWIRFKNKENTEFKTNKVFLHIPRTGGKLVQRFLWYTEIADYLRRKHLKPEVAEKYNAWGEKTNSKAPGNLLVHHPLYNFNPEILEQKRVFTIIRNPWEKIASHYWYSRFSAGAMKWKEASLLSACGIYLKYAGWMFPDHKEGVPFFGNSSHILEWSFDEFLEIRNNEYFNDPAMFGMSDHCNPLHNFHSQKSYIQDYDVDCIRFETRAEDLKKYLGDWKVEEKHTDMMYCPAGKIGGYHLKKGMDQRPDYRTMYTEKQIQIVADFMKDDIDYWGFDFDTGSKRNYWEE